MQQLDLEDHYWKLPVSYSSQDFELLKTILSDILKNHVKKIDNSNNTEGVEIHVYESKDFTSTLIELIRPQKGKR